jgi:AraC-like DNA-binding protein
MEFEQEHNQIYFPGHWLSQRIRTGDSATNVLFTEQCEELLKDMSAAQTTSAAVRRLLLYSAGNFLKITEVADRLHITERTLRRNLAAEATDYRSILDEVRNTLAKNYLAKTSLNVGEIADLLSYNETSNFHRAFQRWNSITPMDYRRLAAQ